MPASYVIAEDVVAVGADGQVEDSPLFGKLLATLDVLWGVSGLGVVGAVLGVIRVVRN